MCPVLGELHPAVTYEMWLKVEVMGQYNVLLLWKLHLYLVWSQVVYVAQATLFTPFPHIFPSHCFTKEVK